MWKTLGVSLLIVAGANAQTLYYSGDARVYDLRTGRMTRERLLVTKEVDQARSRIVEVACSVVPGQQPKKYPVYMRVDGNRITAIAESPDYTGNISGTGTLHGEPWNWKYLRFQTFIKIGGGAHEVRIEDGNYVVGNQLIARKEIFYDGVPIQLWEVEAQEESAESYANLAGQVGC